MNKNRTLKLIPAGYEAKRIAKREAENVEWLKATKVKDIYSVSCCTSDHFAGERHSECVDLWKHNRYWLYDSPEIISKIAKTLSLSLDGARMFYYETSDIEFNEETSQWQPLNIKAEQETKVSIPAKKKLEGYDVVCFRGGLNPQCSPLSCNSLAEHIETNDHCLLESLDRARSLLDAGKFVKCEPGPYRIFAVYSVPDSMT